MRVREIHGNHISVYKLASDIASHLQTHIQQEKDTSQEKQTHYQNEEPVDQQVVVTGGSNKFLHISRECFLYCKIYGSQGVVILVFRYTDTTSAGASGAAAPLDVAGRGSNTVTQ